MIQDMKHKGFTIVELVVVIAVIGILAGITVVGYGAWRDRAAKTEVMSDLRNAALAMKNYLNFNNELPPNLALTGFKESPNVTILKSADSNSTKYCIQATSKAKTSIVYFIDSSTNKNPTAGQCPLVATPNKPVLSSGGASYDIDIPGIRAFINLPSGVPVASYKVQYKKGTGSWVNTVFTVSDYGSTKSFIISNPASGVWATNCGEGVYGCAWLRIIAVGSSGAESAPLDIDYGDIYTN